MRDYVLPVWLIQLGEKVAKIPFAKSLLKPIYYPYKARLNKKRNEQFHKNGLKALSSFDKCLTDASIPYFLGFGTLLGAVREHGFIPHDMDIDTCMWYKDYKEKNAKAVLESCGFKLVHYFSIDNGEMGMEQTWVKDGVRIDIFLIYPPVDKLPYTCHTWASLDEGTTRQQGMKKYGYLIPYRLDTPYNDNLVRIDFLGVQLPIPENYDELLSQRYGDDYMIPNPHYVDNPETFLRWEGKKGILTEC